MAKVQMSDENGMEAFIAMLKCLPEDTVFKWCGMDCNSPRINVLIFESSQFEEVEMGVEIPLLGVTLTRTEEGLIGSWGYKSEK